MISLRKSLRHLPQLAAGADDLAPIVCLELAGVGITVVVLRLVADIPDELHLHSHDVLHQVVEIRWRRSRMGLVSANEYRNACQHMEQRLHGRILPALAANR